jgi:hypothetical protein
MDPHRGGCTGVKTTKDTTKDLLSSVTGRLGLSCREWSTSMSLRRYLNGTESSRYVRADKLTPWETLAQVLAGW